MAGTFVTIARLISRGNCTTAECAENLGITKEQLEDRLLQMERQGYLARPKEAPAPGPGSACGHSCCTMCGNQKEACVPVQFILTKKGEHLLEGTKDS